MQASKIIPGCTYAVQKADGNLYRFHVSEVNTITKRRGANRSPHDSHSEVVGHYLDDDGSRGTTTTLPPDSILGPFTDYQALVEEKARRDAEQKAREEARKQQALADRRTLYEFVGVTPPEKTGDHDQLFRVPSYSPKVDISDEGVRALAEHIRARGVA